MTYILDCTTRDGGNSTNWFYTDEYILNLIENLNKKNIQFYEIGYRNYYDNENKGLFYHCTPDLIKGFYFARRNLQIGVMVDAKRYNSSDFVADDKDYVDFVRVAVRPDKLRRAINISEELSSKKYTVMLQLMDITNLGDYEFGVLNDWHNKDIVKTVYLADTYGILKPEKLENYFSILKNLGFKNISFHAHDMTQNALKNTLKAISLGAYSIDVSQTEAGINGGNLQYSELVQALNKV